jgi:hypothetical protein
MPKKKKKKTLGKQERFDTFFRNLSILSKIIGIDGNLVMGIDPGRKSPGIAFRTMGEEGKVEKFSTNTKLKGFGKVIEVESWFLQHLSRKRPGLIMMEDYAFDSEFGREKAGEMGGVIKRNIWIQGIPLIMVAPQSLKAFIGVMRKEEIMKEVLRKWEIDTKKSDEADAVVLVKMGVGIVKIVHCGMMLATEDEKKKFLSAPNGFVNLSQQEAKTLINLIIARGDTAHEFARGKKKARKTQGKQKQTKGGKNPNKNSGKNPCSKTGWRA